jgi:chaperonin GroES
MATELKTELKIDEIVDLDNITDLVEKDDLVEIAGRVLEEADIDESSRENWKKISEEAMKIAQQVIEEKNTPWDHASNVMYPLIATSALQFAARAYPEIVNGPRIVKGKVTGKDPDGSKEERAERISKHMSYQLLEEMTEWEEETDKLLHMLPVLGVVFKKTYYSPVWVRNVSKKVHPNYCLINSNADTIETAARITHIVYLSKNEIIERRRRGLFNDEDLNLQDQSVKTPEGEILGPDPEAGHEFYEQHRYLDLDHDEYAEPYIVTVHKESEKVVRIRARFALQDIERNRKNEVVRINPIHYFTKFGFIPNPDGSFYDIGFGQLLYGINASINTGINQLFDAGSAKNAGGGLLSKDVKIREKVIKVKPSEFQRVECTGQALKDGIFPWPFPEPSMALFQLVGKLEESGQKLTSTANILSGETERNETATTTLARIEQALKLFTGIHKRLYRSFSQEYRKIAALNALYLPDEVYYRILDEKAVVARADYALADCDVQPTADPNAATDIQRMMRAEAVMKFVGDPDVDQWEIKHGYLTALKVENIDKILPAKKPPVPPPPDPKLVEAEAKIDIEKTKVTLEAKKLDAELREIESRTILNIANAEKAEIGDQLEYYKGFAEKLSQQLQAQEGAVSGTPASPPSGVGSPELGGENAGNNAGGIPGMAPGLPNAGSVPPTASDTGPPPGIEPSPAIAG